MTGKHPWACFLGSLLAILIGGYAEAEEALGSLLALRWEYRVILVRADGSEAAAAEANLRALDDGVRERDIAWFVLGSDSMISNYKGALAPDLAERIKADHFEADDPWERVVLIGKDGGVKDRSPDLDLEKTFQLIDRMPMRQREMERSD